MLVSVHIPKTAGTAFRQFLADLFAEQLLLDYADVYRLDDGSWPTPSQWYPRLYGQFYARYKQWQCPPARAGCIHGHFAAGKYLNRFPRARLITWLREPVARVVSHYHFWRAHPDPGNRYCRQLIEQNLSLAEFAALAPLRNLQSRYLDDVPLSGFAFVGVTEHFDALLPQVAQLLDRDCPALPGRVNAVTGGPEPSAYERRIILQHNQRDLQAYEAAMARFS